MPSEVQTVREAASCELGDEREQDQREPRQESLVAPSVLHLRESVRPRAQPGQPGPGRAVTATLRDDGEHPLVAAPIFEADEEDALVLAQVESTFAERDLLRPRAEQEGDEACPLVQIEWN
jgi:hypothetical protein